MIEKFNLLISKKANAEAYTLGMNELRKEIQDIEQKIQSSNLEEEKGILSKEKEQKEKEIEKLKPMYSEKKEDIKYEIEKLKKALNKHIDEFRSKVISSEEYNKLVEEKKSKESELEKCETYIQRAKEKLKELLGQDGGYDQDTASISKELDNLTAYRTYINEEIDELDNKLNGKIIIEENIEKLKNMKALEMKLVGLSYDSLEKWVESEQKSLEEVLGIKEKGEEKDTPPVTPPSSDKGKGEGTDIPPVTPSPSDKGKGEGTDTPPVTPSPSDKGKGEEKDTPPVTPLPSDKEKGKGIDIEEIEIIPIENLTRYHSKIKDDEINNLNYNKDEIKKILGYLKEYSNENKWSYVKKAIDPNVVKTILSTTGGIANGQFKEQITKYFNVLSGKKENLKLEYDLKDIYKSNLSRKQIKNLVKIAKAAQKSNPELVNIDRDSLIKRFFGNIGKRMQSVKLLGKGKDEKSIEEIEPKKKTKLIDKLRAKKTEHKKRTNIISKSKSIASSLGKKLAKGTRYVATEARVVGARFSGHFRGESTRKTEMIINNIRQKYKVEKPIDHEVVNKEVTEQAEKEPLETADYTIEEVK